MDHSMGTFLNIENQYHGNQNNGSSIRLPSSGAASFLQGLMAGSMNNNIVDLLEDSNSDTSAALAQIIRSSKTKPTVTANTAIENDFMSTLINQTVSVTNVDNGEHVEPTSTAKNDLTRVYQMKNNIHCGIVCDFARAARINNSNATLSDIANLLNGISQFPSNKHGRPIIMSSSNKMKAAKK